MSNPSPSNDFLHQQNKLALLEALHTLEVHNHIALIYETHEEQFDAVIPFLETGLQRNEKCVYITDDNVESDVVDAGTAYGLDMEAAFESGDLTITDPSKTYLREGYFDPDEMFEFFEAQIQTAKDEGYDALRASGEMTWQLGGGVDEDILLEYESRLNRFLDEHDMLAICQYSRERFEPGLLQEVVRTHPNLVYGYTVADNQYYIPPDDYLDQDPGRELDRMLTNVLDHDQLKRRLTDREDQMKVLSTVLRHNIRNEMTKILGNVELLEDAENGSGGDVETVFEAAQRLIELSDKAREAESILEQVSGIEPIDLEPVLRQQVETVQNQYPDAEIATDLDRPGTVLALPSIADAVQELLVNGIKHNDRTHPELTVSVKRDGGAIEVAIADDGPGIPEMEVATLTQEHEIDPLYHGSGLGLWVVQWIVSRSYGELQFTEREPRGSIVTVRLARAESATQLEQV